MNWSANLILQAVAETDRTLSTWADYLSRDEFFELGHDPVVLGRLEEDLEQLSRRLGELGEEMRPGRAPMRQAMSYFAARGELEKTTQLLRSIRLKNQGTVSQTAKFLTQAETCRLTFHKWASLLQQDTFRKLH